MSSTLNRQEYLDLVAVYGPEEYPKGTHEAIEELRQRGFDASKPRMDYLIKRGKVCPDKGAGGNYQWSEDDIDAAAEALGEAGLLGPEAQMNELLGISYAQRLQALWKAWKALEKRFPGRLSVNPVQDYFVMHVHPPRMTHDGWVEFTPCEDIIKGLKAKPAPDFIPIPIRRDEIEAEEAKRREKGGSK